MIPAQLVTLADGGLDVLIVLMQGCARPLSCSQCHVSYPAIRAGSSLSRVLKDSLPATRQSGCNVCVKGREARCCHVEHTPANRADHFFCIGCLLRRLWHLRVSGRPQALQPAREEEVKAGECRVGVVQHGQA